MSEVKKGKTRRQKVEAREADILKAAHSTFLEKGFEKATMAEIAKRCSLSEGGLYLYFDNKKALMLAVLRTFYVTLTESAEVGILKYQTTKERLHFLAHLHLGRSLDEWQMLMLASTLYRDSLEYQQSEQYLLNKTYVKTFDNVIREARNRGDIPSDKKVSILRDVFYGSLEHLGRTLMLRGDADTYEKHLNMMLPSLFSAVGLTQENEIGTRSSYADQIDKLEAIVKELKQM
ncbi:TetR/AcrR family transcriptional regulator [Kordiimonas sp. SCSIO 12610]|uniref:TetR/AcrR family transcriptional regulator n=1 Tax=Kordiimonas sp. SCSIO 12610 TaxID=2829597 RepID=UPI0021097863|nr:TetR/AcrR family transcriptional regulator [Kordiimonas sp. SCSIO 12610]UTW54761.1 TetR/AcrR family transcriptional regulator [Kordiimonas sp. SCSIO 12610]